MTSKYNLSDLLSFSLQLHSRRKHLCFVCDNCTFDITTDMLSRLYFKTHSLVVLL